ncbi:MAG: MBL fold metallo-hydrolase [Polyangiaceae bacterium]
MAHIVLYEDSHHKNVLLEDVSSGLAVQANQHVIVHGGAGMVLDPGGHKVYSKVLAATMAQLGKAKLDKIFLSHQDPDIVAATNGWLMTTDATAYISSLWVRFVPHFGLDRLVESRLLPIPDQGMKLGLGGLDLLVLPAHFLHSCGNFHIYDSVSRILYSGDLGASVGTEDREVVDFDAHLQFMAGFHQRYMGCNRVLKAWVKMVRKLDVQMIAPQHGAFFRGKVMVDRFLSWCESLQCGTDLIDEFKVPS